MEARLRRIRGVLEARANPLTGNVVIRFEPAATDGEAVLASVRGLEPELGHALAGHGGLVHRGGALDH